MTRYRQLTSGERHELSALRKQGLSQAQIARALSRDRSTISRELRRNVKKDGAYRPALADDYGCSEPERLTARRHKAGRTSRGTTLVLCGKLESRTNCRQIPSSRSPIIAWEDLAFGLYLGRRSELAPL